MDTRRPAGLRSLLVAVSTAAFVVAGTHSDRPALQAETNPIVTENALAGSPKIEWDIVGAGDPTIQGFATDISVNVGDPVHFKIKLDDGDGGPGIPGYVIDIYRLGFYQGFGARKVGRVVPTGDQITAANNQPDCDREPASGLVDCGKWAVSGSFDTTGMTSGVFIARPSRTDTLGASHIVFIVRDDARKADVLFQTSDTTWQAYNTYPGLANGGGSLYCNGPLSNRPGDYSCLDRAAKVSYNRPFDTRAHDATSWLFNAEYPMLRWIEANGYNVKYWSGVDTERLGAALVGLNKPKAFLSVGHDEYWSGAQRTNVERARDAGVNLAFFSGNEMFWKTRYEKSIDGSNTDYRTLVSYKETFATGTTRLDPVAANPWTGTWRDPRFSPPLDARPENALIGQLWTVNCCSARLIIPSSMKHLRFWRNTAVAALPDGEVYVGPNDSLGYEWDEDVEDASRPAGLIRMSETFSPVDGKLLDYGTDVGPGTATHHLTMYRHNSGALVFGAGTVQWSWGLDGTHDRLAVAPDRAMQQATVNLLADMGAQPQTLQRGADDKPLLAASKSEDLLAPMSDITSPLALAAVPKGGRVRISGTAADADGGAVAGVEVSVDGGATWRPAQLDSPTRWSFDWQPQTLGNATLRSRAIDDSGNLESAKPGIVVNVTVGDCPCTSLWKPTTVPGVASAADAGAYELGVKFYSDVDGFITGIRFYKGPANLGTHLGHLWTESGTLLATATFANETETGWQQVLFDKAIAITANTTYVASYHTNLGGYAFDGGYFDAGVDSSPLHAPSSSASGGNGVFASGGSTFPNSSFGATNYWVDVVFARTVEDTAAPVISRIKSAIVDSSRVSVTWTTNEDATSEIQYSTDPAILTIDAPLPAGTVVVKQTAFVTQHSVTLPGLRGNTTYYYRVVSVDRAGNVAKVAAPTFTVPGPTLRDTSATDFAAGASSGAYIAESGDGEIILAPAAGSEFSGPGLTPGWSAVPWATGGFASIGSGRLLVDGSRVGTCVDEAGVCQERWNEQPGHRLDFVATFSGDPSQHAGFGQTLSDAPWAIFSTGTGGTLFARSLSTAGPFANDEIANGAQYLGEPHRYTIDWQATRIDYFIDGALVMSHPFPVAGPMRPVAASDFSIFGGNIVVDWIRMSPYAASGTFESRVFDAGAAVDWSTIQWTAKAPAGTAVHLAVRVGDTPAPGAGWTEWVPVAAPGPLTLRSRYIQYQAVLATSDVHVTPSLTDVIVSTGHAPVAVNDAIVVQENGVKTLPPVGVGSLVANDSDADGDPLEVVAVGPASHGTAVVLGDGSVRYTPHANYSGADAFAYTVSDGLMTASANVAVDVRFGNIPPVAASDFYQLSEDGTVTVTAAAGVLQNDTDDDRDTLSAVLTSLPLRGLLTLNSGGGFTYTPNRNYAGPDGFTYKAFDGQDHSNDVAVSINVLPVNDAPISEPDSYTAVLNQPLNVTAARGVLANDRDVEVEDTAPLRARVLSQPLNGVVTLNDDGSFVFVPNADFLGADTFTYEAIDHFNAAGVTTTATITTVLKAVDEAASGGATVSTGGDVTPADPFATSVTVPTAATVRIAQGVIAGSQPPTGFTFVNQQANITILTADGAELSATAANPIRVTFTIDGSLVLPGETEATVQVFRNGVNIPDCLGLSAIPAATSDPCVTKREGGPALNNDVRITILSSHASKWNMGLSAAAIGAAPRAQNDGVYQVDFQTPLTVAASGILGNDYGRSGLTAVLSAGSESGGSVVLAPSGAFVFTPGAGVCGPASFKYRASDGSTASNEATVRINVDCRPHAEDDAVPVLEDSGMSTITVLSNDTDPDPDQTLTVTDVARPAHGLASIAAGGRAIAYSPDADFFGVDSFEYTISDGRGGTSTAKVLVTVLAVNDAPRFTRGANQSVLEDAAAQSVVGWATAIGAGPANESEQVVDFKVATDKPALFAVRPAISPAGTLTFTPAPDANGTATVTVEAHDNGGLTQSGFDTSAGQTFTIAIAAVNDAPSFAKGPDVTVPEDAGAQSIASWATAISRGPADEAGQDLNFVLTNTNSALFSVQPSISPAGALTFTPAANAHGSAVVSVRLHDSGGTFDGGVDTSATETFGIEIAAVNDNPVANGDEKTLAEDSAATAIDVMANDSFEPDAGETLTVTSVTQGSHGGVSFTATGVSYTPAANYNGPDSFTYTIGDGHGGAATASVKVTVTSVNDDPVAANDATTVAEDSGTTAIDVLANDNMGPDAGETLTVTSITQGAHGSVAFTASGVSYTPAANYNGSDSFTYTIGDGNGGVATATVNVTVTPVNDNPVAGADTLTVLEDGAAAEVNVTANDTIGPDADETLTVTAVTQAAHGTVAIAAGGVRYTPAANYYGSDSFTYTIGDGNGGTATATVDVTVTPVNDAPSFTPGSDQSAGAGAGVRTVAAWATDIRGGPANESTQTVAFIVTNDNNALFTVQPSLSSDGTLTYTPAAGGGTARVSVRLKDNGGTTNGGVDSSATAVFTIAVPITTTTTLTSPTASPTTFGQNVVLNAAVTSGGGLVTGTVDFVDGVSGLVLGSVALTNGSASLTTAGISAGAASPVKAVYRPTPLFLTSEASIVRAVNKAATTTTLTAATAQYSDITTFDTTVTGSGAGAPAKSASFKVGTAIIGTADLLWDAATGRWRATYVGPLLEPTYSPTGGALRPGAKVISVVYNTVSSNYSLAGRNGTMQVKAEDASATYVGDTAVQCTACSAVAVTLKARVAELDAFPGDLRNASVTFVNRATGATIGTAVADADGIASFTWTANLGTAATQTTKIGMLVGTYYVRNNTADDATVVITKR